MRKWVILAFAAIIVATIVVVRQIDIRTAQTGFTSASTSQSTSNTGITGTCVINGSGYRITLTNSNPNAVQITGFTVLFNDANGNELASDTEPGNGLINDRETINMNDWIGAGDNFSWNVAVYFPLGTESCTVINYAGE